MANQGRKLDAYEQRQLARLAQLSVREAARAAGVSPATIQKYRQQTEKKKS